MRLNYSIFVIAPLFALALAPSANSTKQMRSGTGDLGVSAAREPAFTETVADDAAVPDTSGRDDGAAVTNCPTTSDSVSSPSCPAVYLCNSADQCRWERAC
jgi:hypothetical protein